MLTRWFEILLHEVFETQCVRYIEHTSRFGPHHISSAPCVEWPLPWAARSRPSLPRVWSVDRAEMQSQALPQTSESEPALNPTYPRWFPCTSHLRRAGLNWHHPKIVL